jgi:MarR family transcriptional regulator for hemolysin
MSNSDSEISLAGLAGDPVEFLAMTEISIISHLADNIFASVLPKGLTVAQFGVLNHLLRLDTQETIGELASAMEVSQPTMSSTVRKLEDKACVILVTSEQDRRIRRVHVTEAGQTLRNEAVMSAVPLQQRLAGQLPHTQWQQLLPILTKIRSILDAERK